jgi:hypothetical protein
VSAAAEAGDRLGPVDYLVVEFPDGKVGSAGFATLLGLVERGLVYVVDIEFVAKAADGTLSEVEAHDLGEVDGVDFALFDGASTRLLDQADRDLVAADLSPGALAAVVVYEELSMLPVLQAWERDGGRVVVAGPVLPEDLVEALDTVDAADATGPA